MAKHTGLSLDACLLALRVVLNFAVVAGVILYFSTKYLPGVFRDRTAHIQKAMQEARQASEDANRRLAEIESRLSRLDSEIASMRAAAEKEVDTRKLGSRPPREEDARKIVQSAEQEIAAAAKSARRELTAYAANLAVSLAAKQIQSGSRPPMRLWCASFAPAAARDGTARGKAGNSPWLPSPIPTPAPSPTWFLTSTSIRQDPTGGASPWLQLVAGSSRELREVWEAPSIPAEQKRAVLDAIVAREEISRPVRNFMAVLIDHRRVDFLEPIVKQFEQELNQRLGFTEAEISSARELSQPERQSVRSGSRKVDRQKGLGAIHPATHPFSAEPLCG